MRLLIIRHADPDYARDSLTPKGRREAALLTERLVREDIAAFYVSPLGRAKETAREALEKTGKTATELEWLKEFPIQLENKNGIPGTSCLWDWLPSIWTQAPAFYDKDAWADVPVFSHIGVRAEYERITANLDALLEKHGYRRNDGYYEAISPNRDTIALFCHFGLACVLLSHLLGVSPMVLWHGFCAAPSSVTTVYTEERRAGLASFRVAAFGDVSHLYAAGEPPAQAARFCETYGFPGERID